MSMKWFHGKYTCRRHDLKQCNVCVCYVETHCEICLNLFKATIYFGDMEIAFDRLLLIAE